MSACWKCTGTGKKYSKKTRAYDGAACGVCNGTGQFGRVAKSEEELPPGVIPPSRCPEDGVVPGLAASARAPFDLAPRRGEIVAPFGNGWRIYQIAQGHKLTSDDLLCANVCCDAIRAQYGQGVRRMRHIDLGCGCGSVLFAVARFARAIGMRIESFGVEAQKISHFCCERGIYWNGIEATTSVELQDLRKWNGPQLPSETIEWTLISGTPPYFATSSFIASPAAVQKGPCRMLMRGQGIDYASKATDIAQSVSSMPTDLVLVDASRNESIMNAWMADRADLWCPARCLRVLPKTGKPPRFAIWMWSKRLENSTLDVNVEELTLRNAANEYTGPYEQALKDVGYKGVYRNVNK